MIDIVPADRVMLSYLLEHLRDADRREMEACEANLEALPREIMRRGVFCFCACHLGHGPVSAWGMVHGRSGVGAGFAFGTARWGEGLLPMVRHIKAFVFPFLLENGFHRVEAQALAYREDVARFMYLLGARPEGLLRGYGVGGEDFISYRWLANEHARERYQTSAVCSHTAH